MPSDFAKRESAQLAAVVLLCRNVVAAYDAITDAADGAEKAEETRQKLYEEVVRVGNAINGLYAIHAEGQGRLDA